MRNWKDTNHQAFYQIPAELINAGGRKFRCEICKIINFSCDKEKLPEKWKESIVESIYKKSVKQIVIIIE
jgi:hypothetical protein